MKIVQITPGAGGMYCGGCFHDNALVAALRKLGHDTLMVPLYLPLTLDEPDQSAGTPVFFGGLSVYLEHHSALFRHAPPWVRQLLTMRPLLKWAAGKAAKTRPQDVGDLPLSMLRGEQGHQARELDELIGWLKTQHPPDIVCLSNALLAGLARRLKADLRVPVVCWLQGEDSFLDELPVSHRDTTWRVLAERVVEIDRFIAPSHYYANHMAERLELPGWQICVVPNGINLDGFEITRNSKLEIGPLAPPVLGYFARMCPAKGLDALVTAYLQLKKLPGLEKTRLHIGGGCGPNDEPFVAKQRQRLAAAGVAGDVQFFPNVDRAGKVEFFHSLSVFSVPALYGEAFGLYVIEALAAGVPVVQPRHASFPELIEATGGGVLCEPGDPTALAGALALLLANPARARELGQRGQQAVREKFTAERMAKNVVKVCEEVTARKAASTPFS